MIRDLKERNIKINSLAIDKCDIIMELRVNYTFKQYLLLDPSKSKQGTYPPLDPHKIN